MSIKIGPIELSGPVILAPMSGVPDLPFRRLSRALGAGLVVMGTRGHTGLAGVLLGSVAQDIIAHIDVPVTLVK